MQQKISNWNLHTEIGRSLTFIDQYNDASCLYVFNIPDPNICHKNCDWFLRRLREVGILENLDSLKTIKLQICLDDGALSALSRSIIYKIVRNIQVKDVLLSIRV